MQDSGFQDLVITTKLVDDKSLDKGSYVVWQQFNRPVQACKDAAAFDVAYQYDLWLYRPGTADVHDIPLVQVDLSRTSRALDHDQVVDLAKSRKRIVNDP